MDVIKRGSELSAESGRGIKISQPFFFGFATGCQVVDQILLSQRLCTEADFFRGRRRSCDHKLARKSPKVLRSYALKRCTRDTRAERPALAQDYSLDATDWRNASHDQRLLQLTSAPGAADTCQDVYFA